MNHYGEALAAIHATDFAEHAERAAAAICERLADLGVTSGTVVDLGCGAGAAARIFVDRGYDVLGSDLAPAMVAACTVAVPEAHVEVAAATEATMPTGAVAVVAIGEVLSYAESVEDFEAALSTVLGRAAGALLPGGLFVADLLTPGRLGPTGRYSLEHDRATWSLTVEGREDLVARTVDRVLRGRALVDGVWAEVDDLYRQITCDEAALVEASERAGFVAECTPGYVERLGVGLTVLWGTKNSPIVARRASDHLRSASGPWPDLAPRRMES